MSETGPAKRAGLPAWMTPARLIMAVFFMQAVLLNNWFPRIPDVQEALGLGPAELSIALLAMPIGGFLATSLAGRLIERLSARTTIMTGFAVYGVIQLLPGWAWSLPTLVGALFLMGVTYVVGDVAANVEATRIQESIGRRIISTSHGFWSVGSMVGLVTGSWFAEADIETRWHMAIVALLVIPIGVAIGYLLPTFTKKVEAAVEKAPRLSLPSLAMAPLCLFAFGVILGELTTRNWGAVYLREVIGASPAAAGVGFAAFSLGMAGFRFAGDKLADRFGPVALGRFCAGMAVIGVFAIVFANNLPLAVVGFAALGIGVSVGFPLAVSAAAAMPERTAATNVAALSLIAYTGSLIGPPLVGFVAQSGGLRLGLAAILPLMILSALFAGSLRPRR